MQDIQTTINTQNVSTSTNVTCPIDLQRLGNIIKDPNQIEQINPEYLKITNNQLATVLNIILGKTNVICGGYTNITETNPQSQTQSLDRLQQAGAILSNLAKDRDLHAKYSAFTDNINKPNKGNTNPAPTSQTSENIQNIAKELKQSAPLLKSAGTWLSIVLPSILDFFLIIAIALFPIKIVMEMVIGSISGMMMFIPNTKSAGTFAKHALGIILYIPAVIVGYFSANVILNYVLELGIGLSFESMQYRLMQGGSIDIEHFKTVTMIFVSIGGAITMMCGSLILGIPAAVNRFLQAGDGEGSSVNSASNKLDSSIGSAGAGSASSGQIFGSGSPMGAIDKHDERGKKDSLGTEKHNITDKNIVSDDQGAVQGNRDDNGIRSSK